MNKQLFHPTFLEKATSWILPKTIASTPNKSVSIIFSRNNYLLSTADAYYSNGLNYFPFNLAFNYLNNKQFLNNINSVLVLGAGLGSLVQILEKKSPNLNRKYELVELNPFINDWCQQFLQARLPLQTITNIQKDALAYLKSAPLFDLICVDIFQGRTVPEAFEEKEFFELCKKHLNTNACFVMNYIINDESRLNFFKEQLTQIFTPVTVLQENQNLIIIYTNMGV